MSKVAKVTGPWSARMVIEKRLDERGRIDSYDASSIGGRLGRELVRRQIEALLASGYLERRVEPSGYLGRYRATVYRRKGAGRA